jgi:pyruvate dehydrogenase E1 component
MSKTPHPPDGDPIETEEWIKSLDAVLHAQGKNRTRFLLTRIIERAKAAGVDLPTELNTPYINTIPAEAQAPYPGDGAIEWRIRSIVRWNAMAMVVRANKKYPGIGGHISTFASAATLYEVAFNHFLRGKNSSGSGDQVYFQGHAAPGIYARAFLEGRITLGQMENFRRELERGGGLSSYPHPWLMPDFWEFPTVSMGLSPITAVYQARFNRYLQARGILNTQNSRVWCFLGDGETDEPETLGSLSLAARENLDNLTFVVNCNLQRLDGPVRGNGKIIQELEAVFRGAGWNVLKLIWGSDWDPLLKADTQGLLVKRMGEVVDGQYQKYSVAPGDHTRKEFFGVHPELLKMVEHLSDKEIRHLRRGGHDPDKVYAAYRAAVEHQGQPTAILAKTIKGYGLGEAGEGRNITHQQKKLNEEELIAFRDRFQIPISDEKISEVPFYRPDPKSEEIQYLLEHRRQLGGPLPHRMVRKKPLSIPPLEYFKEMLQGTDGDRAVSTTMAFARLLNLLIREPHIGKRIVPIIPDEARTFGLDPLFRQVGIYSSLGQLYEPVDKEHLLYYRESKDGQVLEEGITEAGSMATLTAAGTSYATHGEPMIPFYIVYSMFGFQRTGDQLWAFGDLRGRGFMLGATAGRTTLAGEGLQHQDGHSHLLASTIPNIKTYHPAFAYEIAVIIQDGLKRMYVDQEDIFYYLTLENENYPMPSMPQAVEEGILKGLYKFRPAEKGLSLHVQLFGSSSLLREALQAQEILAQKFSVSSDVWSVTSYQQLRQEALDTERWNLLHPEASPRISFLQKVLAHEHGPFIAVSDFMKAVPDQIARWVPGGLFSLGTDGYGRSDGRESLRDFFEVDARWITLAALAQLAKAGKLTPAKVKDAIKEFGIDPEKPNPLIT